METTRNFIGFFRFFTFLLVALCFCENSKSASLDRTRQKRQDIVFPGDHDDDKKGHRIVFSENTRNEYPREYLVTEFDANSIQGRHTITVNCFDGYQLVNGRCRRMLNFNSRKKNN